MSHVALLSVGLLCIDMRPRVVDPREPEEQGIDTEGLLMPSCIQKGSTLLTTVCKSMERDSELMVQLVPTKPNRVVLL